MKKKIVPLLLLCVFAVLFFCCVKNNQWKKLKFPRKNITVICPWVAGGGTDAILRALCDSAEDKIGVALTVENIVGGGGANGHKAIKNATPDGHTIGMITFELNSLTHQGLIDFSYKDYDPIIRVNSDAAALTVPVEAPYDTVEEFISYAKKNPGKIRIGNSGKGSVWHIGAGLLANETDIEVEHVFFEGAAPAVTALVCGQIEAVSVSLAEVKAQIDIGMVKVLGLMAPERMDSYPQIPTFQEQGLPLYYSTWRGLAFPKGVDPTIKELIVDVFTETINDADFIERAKKMNLTLAYLDSTEFEDFLSQNFDAVGKTLKETNLLGQ